MVRLLEPEFEVVGTVGDGLALLDAETRMKPDVCVLDIRCRDERHRGRRRLRKRGSAAKVVFLTVHEDPDFVRAALATAALGYVVKSRMASDLSSAIREALAERLFVSPSCCFAMRTNERRRVLERMSPARARRAPISAENKMRRQSSRRGRTVLGLAAGRFGPRPPALKSWPAWRRPCRRGLSHSYIALLRSDLRAKKTGIISESLLLTDKESETFWPMLQKL